MEGRGLKIWRESWVWSLDAMEWSLQGWGVSGELWKYLKPRVRATREQFGA